MTELERIRRLSKFFKLLSDRNRLRILFAIGKGRKTVSEIMQVTGLPQPLVSFHLRPLREKGILRAEREGPFVYYSLSEPSLYDFLLAISDLEIEDGLGDESCPPIAIFRKLLQKSTKEG